MAPIDFIPKHNQPFTLEQAMLLEIDILVAGKSYAFVYLPLALLLRPCCWKTALSSSHQK